MRGVLLCLCLCGSLLAQDATSSSPTGTAAQSSSTSEMDQNIAKAKSLIQQMIQALGGENYLHLTDIEQEGRTNGFYRGNPTGASAPYWRFFKFPDKERVELTKQRDWIVIHNGGRGTETTYHGTRPEDDDVHRDYVMLRQHSLENVLRNWLNAPGTALFYDGPGFTDNHQVEKVTIANAQDQQATIAMDSSSHLPIRLTFSVRNPQYKDKDTYSEIYSQYRLVQGIQTPFVVTRMKNDEMVSQRFLTKVIYNQGLKDDLFVPPTQIAKKR